MKRIDLIIDALEEAANKIENAYVAIHIDEALAAARELKTELAKPEQEPVAVWELQEGGWDTIADADWMETLPIGTKLYALGQSK